MTRAMLDAKARLADAKEMLQNYVEYNNGYDEPNYFEELLDLEMDVWFAREHILRLEGESQS